ncbi:MAG: hypothetical protein K6G33_12570 [Ruminococcus sp.]|uniref:hypothetical protein n=1 Tax=Ruminococcus sp. TaxID=41978 RepID=UPI0025DE1159|nr:hypothetical protein [Ruminococcus sp.]MCR5601563.1 hypothetical protein [Ruminococcus sp.]
MTARKDNKVYNVDKNNKASYLAAGYDIYDDSGKLIERSASSTVSRKEYDELLAKYNALAAEKLAAPAEEQPKKKGKSGGEPDVSESK